MDPSLMPEVLEGTRLFVGFGVEGCGCVEGVVDDDEVVVSACGQGDGVVSVFVVGEVDGVVGVDDVEPAQEAGAVQSVFVSFGGDFHGQECFGVRCLDGESVEVFEFDPGGVLRDEGCGVGKKPCRQRETAGQKPTALNPPPQQHESGLSTSSGPGQDYRGARSVNRCWATARG